VTRPTQPSPVDRLETPYVPPGHPVRRFVVAVVGVGTAALLLWWSALVAPRLDAAPVSGQAKVASHVGILRVELANRAPTPVDIRSAHVDADGFTSHLVTIDGRSPVDGARLGRGEHAVVIVVYRYESCRALQATRRPVLTIDVRTTLGLHRTRSIDLGGGLPLDAPCTD